ncbi:MAG: response regulator transcription factor [Rhodospirillaceae bacterium]|nr:response regulator transcription factor [Rhodospirillaceae bacterium]
MHAVLADDHPIVRAGLRSALQTPALVDGLTLEVVAEAGDGLAAIGAVRRHRPHLLVLDVAMPHAGGVEVVIEVRRWSPQTRIVVFTGVTAPGLIADLIDSGIDGLFSKAADNAELFDKLAMILNGGRHVAAAFVETLERAAPRTRLTDRERQTLNMVIAGRSNREIAEGLGISIKTVDKHRTSLMQKLEVSSVAQLVARALKEGLIDPAKEL